MTIAILLACLLAADRLTRLAEDNLYGDRIVYARSSPHQRIVVTQKRGEFQLFLNGNLQFNSNDEYRYHEALVHPAMSAAGSPYHVLVLGGGDGLAAREILKHASVKSVTIVDIDPAITHMARDFAPFAELNRHALDDPRVRVVNQDAMIWLERSEEAFDVAIIDFPDPNNFSLGKLYTTRFYRLLQSRLTPDAAVAVQCTSPMFARQSYWCIVRTMESAGFTVKPYHTPVPSFGVWGFALAKITPFNTPSRAPAGLKFLDNATMAGMFVLPVDLAPVEVQVNRLDNQALVHYYETELRRLQ